MLPKNIYTILLILQFKKVFGLVIQSSCFIASKVKDVKDGHGLAH